MNAASPEEGAVWTRRFRLVIWNQVPRESPDGRRRLCFPRPPCSAEAVAVVENANAYQGPLADGDRHLSLMNDAAWRSAFDRDNQFHSAVVERQARQVAKPEQVTVIEPTVVGADTGTTSRHLLRRSTLRNLRAPPLRNASGLPSVEPPANSLATHAVLLCNLRRVQSRLEVRRERFGRDARLTSSAFRNSGLSHHLSSPFNV